MREYSLVMNELSDTKDAIERERCVNDDSPRMDYLVYRKEELIDEIMLIYRILDRERRKKKSR